VTDALGLVEPDLALGHGVVAVTDAADRGEGADVGEPGRVADGGVLTAGVAVMDQLGGLAAGPQRHVERVEGQLGRHGRFHPPADDPAAEHVGDERREHGA
jgi:hypothetical protein